MTKIDNKTILPESIQIGIEIAGGNPRVWFERLKTRVNCRVGDSDAATRNLIRSLIYDRVGGIEDSNALTGFDPLDK